MPLFEGQDEERTENASAYRREEFRKQGTVALSRELLGIALLIFVGSALYFGVGSIRTEFEGLTKVFFTAQDNRDLGKVEVHEFLVRGMRAMGGMLLPVLSMALLGGILTCIAQVGFYITWEPLSPKWERINPINGFQKLLSGQGLMEAFKAIIKMGIATWVTWSFLKKEVFGIGNYLSKTTPEISALLMSSVGRLTISLVLALGVMAALDYFWQKFQLEKQMKMTRREAKEEFKMREGDPLMKQRIRNVQRKIASRRMMEAIPKADVIVTNPTHLAIALQYDPETMAAPKVTAKGAGVIADKIRELAKFHRIPIVENKPLARTMFKEIEVGHAVPKELYKAVAEVLAYVYKLRGMTRVREAAVA